MTQIELNGLLDKNIVLQFSEDNTSTNGGLFFVKQIMDKFKIPEGIADRITDERNQDYITYEMKELVSQRIYQLCSGYEDINDSDKLRKDPVLRLLSRNIGSDIKPEDVLASTPTMSRLENKKTIKEIHSLIEFQVALYLKRNKKRFNKLSKKNRKFQITFDLDPTDVKLHGAQQLALFNGYYGSMCYLPLVIADGDNGDFVFSILRPGTKHAKFLLINILERLFKMIENVYPNVSFKIRADSGFQCAELFEYLENNARPVLYSIALIGNKNLDKNVILLKQETETKSNLLKETVVTFTEFIYSSDSWNKERRIVCKIEVNSHATDVRYIVTSDTTSSPEIIKNDYNQRAKVENIIKEFKTQMFGGRLSCHDFRSNFFRLILSGVCFVIFQELKKKLGKTSIGKAYVGNLREFIIKVSAKIVISARRILVLLPTSYPHIDAWNLLAKENS